MYGKIFRYVCLYVLECKDRDHCLCPYTDERLIDHKSKISKDSYWEQSKLDFYLVVLYNKLVKINSYMYFDMNFMDELLCQTASLGSTGGQHTDT